MGIRPAYEVLVVGAGPGGATAAMALAQRGREVLLLDRQAFPRDKACGDGVPAKAIETLNGLGMADKIRAANFYPIHGLRIVSPQGRNFDVDLPRHNAETYVAPRLAFDALLQQHAVDSGAQFVAAQVQAPILSDGRTVGVYAQVNGKREEIRAPVVIGADGATSVIARALRRSTQQFQEKHRAVALRAYIENIEALPHRVEFYFSADVLPGYGWIFPTGEAQANVGVGMRLDVFRQGQSRGERDLRERLNDLLNIPAISRRLKAGWQLRGLAAWPLNLGSQWLPCAFDGALLVGDAAGFINPLTGGGIHNALLSAQLAAEVVDEALACGDTSWKTLRRYERRCRAALGDEMRRSHLIQNWVLRLPFLLDWLVQRMNANSQFARILTTKL